MGCGHNKGIPLNDEMNTETKYDGNKEINDELFTDQKIFKKKLHAIMTGSHDSYSIDLYYHFKDLDETNYMYEREKRVKYREKILDGYINQLNIESLVPKDIYELIGKFMDIKHILVKTNKVEKFIYTHSYISDDFEITYFPIDTHRGLKRCIQFLDYIDLMVYVTNISQFDELNDSGSTTLLKDIHEFSYCIRLLKPRLTVLCVSGFTQLRQKLKQKRYNFSEYGLKIADNAYHDTETQSNAILEYIIKLYKSKTESLFFSYTVKVNYRYSALHVFRAIYRIAKNNNATIK